MPKFIAFLVIAATLGAAEVQPRTRLKEIVTIEGVRDNQLIGYGIVVGLNGTGDRRQALFSAQSLTNVLQQMGVAVSPAAIRVNNTAAVLVTATLPPFAQPGSRIDVTAAAIGDASNLQGGLLIVTSLKGLDGKTYAIAQGPVATGGFIAGGASNKATVNHPTVGRVPDGATIEQAGPAGTMSDTVRLQLKSADFTTAVRIAEALNRRFPSEAPLARAKNSALVEVRVPPDLTGRTPEFIAQVESTLVEPDRIAKIVINERTGTIVLGREVRIAPVAIMHGSLTVEISTAYEVSQPAPLSGGTTTVTPRSDVGVKEEKARNLVLKEGASVDELVRALGSIGVTPRDVIAILQNLKAAGALEAVIELI